MYDKPDLCSQLLIHILDLFQTISLLPLASVCHRLHDLVVRIFRRRLAQATTLNNQILFLECYHPARKGAQSPMPCRYLGTDGLENESQNSNDHNAPGQRLREFNNYYSRFRPLGLLNSRKEGEVRRPPMNQAFNLALDEYSSAPSKEDGHELVKQVVSLDASELFTQLRATSGLVTRDPMRRWFSRPMLVCDGVLRVWRTWLAEKNVEAQSSTTGLKSQNLDVRDHASVLEKNVDQSSRQTRSVQADKGGILWVNSEGQNFGVRFRVRARGQTANTTDIRDADEDTDVSYTIEYEGKHCNAYKFGTSIDNITKRSWSVLGGFYFSRKILEVNCLSSTAESGVILMFIARMTFDLPRLLSLHLTSIWICSPSCQVLMCLL